MTWPHIETTEDYRRFEKSFADGTDGLRFFSVGSTCQCPDCNPDDEPEESFSFEPFFSFRPCDVCSRSLGGTKDAAHYVDDDGEVCHMEICRDCLLYGAYGQLDDATMLEIEESEEMDDGRYRLGENFDALPDEALREMLNHPAPEVIRQYIEASLAAREHRLAGRIPQAAKLERTVEVAYNRLDSSLKW